MIELEIVPIYPGVGLPFTSPRLSWFLQRSVFKLNILYFDRQPDSLAVFLCPISARSGQTTMSDRAEAASCARWSAAASISSKKTNSLAV